MKKILNRITMLYVDSCIFWQLSIPYVKPWKLKDIIYSPVAWYKFVTYSQDNVFEDEEE